MQGCWQTVPYFRPMENETQLCYIFDDNCKLYNFVTPLSSQIIVAYKIGGL